jgi:stage V sporulation protein G
MKKMNNVTVRVYPVDNGGSIKANVSLNIDDTVIVNDFKIIEGKNGLFISNPQRAYQDGTDTKYRDIAYFMDQDVKADFEDAVFAEYEKYQKKPTGRRTKK